MTRETLLGLAVALAIIVGCALLVWLEHRRSERRRRQDVVRASRLARVLDLEAAGAHVTYTTDRDYRYDKAVAGKRQAEARDARLRQVAAEQATPGDRVTRFRRARG